MPHLPGLHIVAELHVTETQLLSHYQPTKDCIDALVKNHGLTNLGDVYHNFSPGGFTAVICLSESHISLHSWPEYNRLHMDVYLSNFLRDNSGITKAIFNELVHFYNATIINQQELKR